jgi:hypothetical protein
MKALFFLLIGVGSLALNFTSGLAADGGGYAGAFLRMGLGARAKGMGGAFTAVAEGSAAGYYNPAGLPRSEYKELTLSYRALTLDRNFNYIGLSLPLRPPSKTGARPLNAGVHLGWIHAGVDNIDGRDVNGTHYGMFSYAENAFTFGFAIQPLKFISVGFTAKVLYNRFPKMTQDDQALTSKGLGVDLGVLVQPIEKLTIGVVAKDLRSKNTWNTENVWERGTTTYNEFPKILRVGLAYRLLEDRLLLAVDFEDNKKQPEKFHLGAEFAPYPNFVLRAGFDVEEPTFGLGYLFPIWRLTSVLDYAYVIEDVAPSGEHLLSWSIRL